MFTGLISDIGIIATIYANQEGKIFTIQAKKTAQELALGDSVAINGTCLTATHITGDQFTAQAVHITLQKTNLGKLNIGSPVNLELSLRATDRLGGHFVQGHVNGIGAINHIASAGNNYEIAITIPEYLQKYMVSEGSIALDGISLTIAKVIDQGVVVSIIPHTWQMTTLHTKKIGDVLNIEADILAKYVEQFTRMQSNKGAMITRDWLQMNGY
jgi:riboflavin synthase